MKFFPEKREKLLHNLAETGAVLSSLKAVGVHRSSYYNRRARKPVFDHAVEVAISVYKTKSAQLELGPSLYCPVAELERCLEHLITEDSRIR